MNNEKEDAGKRTNFLLLIKLLASTQTLNKVKFVGASYVQRTSNKLIVLSFVRKVIARNWWECILLHQEPIVQTIKFDVFIFTWSSVNTRNVEWDFYQSVKIFENVCWVWTLLKSAFMKWTACWNRIQITTWNSVSLNSDITKNWMKKLLKLNCEKECYEWISAL